MWRVRGFAWGRVVKTLRSKIIQARLQHSIPVGVLAALGFWTCQGFGAVPASMRPSYTGTASPRKNQLQRSRTVLRRR